MNKVYKLVWSKVRNCYVAVSELAKSRTKAPKSGIMSRAMVAGVLAYVLGYGVICSNVGYASYTNTSSGVFLVGVGADASAVNINSFVLGGRAYAKETYGYAIGEGAVSFISNSYAFGENAVALGDGAYAIGKNSVALETGTISFGHQAGDRMLVHNGSETFTDGVWDSDGFNRLVNIADGVNDHDAVTVGQLKVTDGTFIKADNDVPGNLTVLDTAASNAIKSASFNRNSNLLTFTKGDNSVFSLDVSPFVEVKAPSYNYGGGLDTGVGAFTINGSYGVAIGSAAVNNGSEGVALGNHAYVGGDNSVAIGYDSFTEESNVVSFGHPDGYNWAMIDGSQPHHTVEWEDHYSGALYRRLVNVADGIGDHDVATVGQLKKINTGKIYGSGTGIVIDTDDNIHVKNVLMYDADANDVATLAGASGTKISNLKAGILSKTSTDAVTGSQLYATNQNIAGFASDIKKNKDNISNLNTSVTAALESVSASSSLVDTLNNTKADASLNNLTVAGQQVISNAAANAVQEYMATHHGQSNVNINNNVNTSLRTLSSLRQTVDPVSMSLMSVNPAPADTNYVVYDDTTADTITLEGTNGTKVTNLAEGSIASGSTDAVTGNQLFDVIQQFDTKADTAYVDDQLSLKADKASVYTKTESDDLFAGKAETKNALEEKADKNASNIDALAWAERLGTGSVEEGNTGLVNGGVVYDAISRVNKSDMVIADYDTGSVRIAGNGKYDDLDVIDVSKSDGSGRVLTGIVVNPQDKTSAANVGYVEAIGQNIANAVNNQFDRMDSKVNRVGANAAALAALTPASFEGDEKWSLAASVGNYRDATAGAIGAFYKPTENVMVNVRGSFGNSESMVAGGVAVAVNKGDIPGVTKRQLAKAVNVQAATIQNQANEIAELKAQMAEMSALVKQYIRPKQ